MKKILLLALTSIAIFAGDYKIKPAEPIIPIEVPQKEVVLLGGLSATYFHKDCGCGTSNKTHIGATIGIDYLLNDVLGVSARITSNWVQTGLFARIGESEGLYGLIGATHSFDIKDTGASLGAGYAFDDFNLEVIWSKFGDNILVSPSILFKF